MIEGNVNLDWNKSFQAVLIFFGSCHACVCLSPICKMLFCVDLYFLSSPCVAVVVLVWACIFLSSTFPILGCSFWCGFQFLPSHAWMKFSARFSVFYLLPSPCLNVVFCEVFSFLSSSFPMLECIFLRDFIFYFFFLAHSVACKRLIHLFDLHSWGPEPNVYKNVLIHIHCRYMLMK